MARIRRRRSVDEPAQVAPDTSPIPEDARPGNAGFTEAVARRAFEIFQARGEFHGRDLDDWLEAERLIREGRRLEGRSDGE